jgi:hypothetical protein
MIAKYLGCFSVFCKTGQQSISGPLDRLTFLTQTGWAIEAIKLCQIKTDTFRKGIRWLNPGAQTQVRWL